MPIGEGWWLNQYTGDYYEVMEHAGDIRRNPEKFGYSPTDTIVRRSFSPEGREALLRDMILRGWIRIRSTVGRYGGHGVIELYEYNNTARDALDLWLRKEKSWPQDRYEIHEIKGLGRTWSTTAGEIMYPSGEEAEERKSWWESFTGWKLQVNRGYDTGCKKILYEAFEKTNRLLRFYQDNRLGGFIFECLNIDKTTGIPITDEVDNKKFEEELVGKLMRLQYPEGKGNVLEEKFNSLKRVYPPYIHIREAFILSEMAGPSSLSRIWQHWYHRGFGIVSAERPLKKDIADKKQREKSNRLTLKDNDFWTEQLRKAITAKGYGYIPVRGVWRGEKAIMDENGEVIGYEPSDLLLVERSFLIPKPSNVSMDDFKADLIKFANLDKVNPQEAVILAYPDGPALLLSNEGVELTKWLRFSPDVTGKGLTQLRRHGMVRREMSRARAGYEKGLPFEEIPKPAPRRGFTFTKEEPVQKESKKVVEVREGICPSEFVRFMWGWGNPVPYGVNGLLYAFDSGNISFASLA